MIGVANVYTVECDLICFVVVNIILDVTNTSVSYEPIFFQQQPQQNGRLYVIHKGNFRPCDSLSRSNGRYMEVVLLLISVVL
jgi:hypothetical protein